MISKTRPIWSIFLLLLPFYVIAQDIEDDELLLEETPFKESLESSSPEIKVEMEKLKAPDSSLISWGRLNFKEFLSFEQWSEEKKLREQDEKWKFYLKRIGIKEKVGSVLSCRGECKLFRGSIPVKAQYMTEILEGDDVTTFEHSYAWLLLLDGTLVRLFPHTNLSLLEINWSKDKIFFHSRLNQGLINWKKRDENEKYETPLINQTNAVELPLPIKEVNEEYFERIFYQQLSEEKKLLSSRGKDIPALTLLVDRLNEIQKNNQQKMQFRKQETLMVTPLGSLISKDASFTLFYEPFWPIVFKNHSSHENALALQLRGYEKKSTEIISSNQWFQTDLLGKEISIVEDTLKYDWIEFTLKRIPSVFLAREIILESWDHFYQALKDEKKLVNHFQTLTWKEDDLMKRQSFLYDYTRRVETAYLMSREKLKKLESVDEKEFLLGFNERYYERALESYRLQHKEKLAMKKQTIKDMSSFQFHGWFLKNAKN
jgi:hypothetical protein